MNSSADEHDCHDKKKNKLGRVKYRKVSAVKRILLPQVLLAQGSSQEYQKVQASNQIPLPR